MAYLGQIPATGSNKSFRILDDITSYTLTFDGSSATAVSAANDTITSNDHRFVQGQRVTYTNGGGGNIGGLTTGTVYYIIKEDTNNIKLATTANNAASNTAINISAVGTGASHTLNVAFDGVNTKFTASYSAGTKVHMKRSAQLSLAVNGVIQQPNDNATPTNGFGFDQGSVIVFSQAPTANDTFWGHILADNTVTFDISDNKVDNFTGNGSTTDFTLSKVVPNNENVLVTVDGVVQYPTDSTTTRAYTVSENVLTFTNAPGNLVAIQVRHIGYAGHTSANVTGFYGRSGNVNLKTTDHILTGHIKSSGIITATSFDGTFAGTLPGISTTGFSTFTNLYVAGVSTFKGDAQFDGDVSIGGTLTYQDVTNVDSVGIATARVGLDVLAGGIDISGGGINVTGVATFAGVKVGGPSGIVTAVTTSGIVTYYGDGSKLTGVAGGKFRGYTAGIGTEVSVGVNTTNLDNSALTGVGNSFSGMYISNGMMIVDNELNGNHYIGTAYNGLMAGPVTVNGTLTVDGNYVVV